MTDATENTRPPEDDAAAEIARLLAAEYAARCPFCGRRWDGDKCLCGAERH